MKTNFLFLGLFLCAGFNLEAQEFKFGFLGGLGFTQSFRTEIDDIFGDFPPRKPISSFNLSVYGAFKGKGNWGMSVEPGIVQKGGVHKNFTGNARFELLFINAPILVDFYIGKKFFFSVGPEPGYLVSAKAHFMDMTSDLSEQYDKEFELSGMIGINYSLNENIDLGLRYSRGLTSIFDLSLTDINGHDLGEIKEYNQYLNAIARYKFNSKNKS